MILGIKLCKTKSDFSLCQSHYIEKMSERFNSSDVLPMRIAVDPSIHLETNRGSSVSQVEYAKIKDSVMFLMKLHLF